MSSISHKHKFLISHRGNLTGPKPGIENTAPRIIDVLSKGYDCEVDLWRLEERWWLGHDGPRHIVADGFIHKHGLWCHAKNLAALEGLMEEHVKHVFWHDVDERALTSSGYIWTYPGQALCALSIAVDIDILPVVDADVAGVCSDRIAEYA